MFPSTDPASCAPAVPAGAGVRSQAAPLLCPRCQAVLGVTFSRTLVVGGAVVRKRVDLECQACHAVATWRPS